MLGDIYFKCRACPLKFNYCLLYHVLGYSAAKDAKRTSAEQFEAYIG